MSEWTVRNGRDAFVDSAQPSRRTPDAKKLHVVAPGTHTEYAYLWVRNPAPKGATINLGELHLFGVGSDGVSATITVQRLADKWSASQVDWDNKPGVTGPTASVTVTQDADGKEYILDIATILQTVTDSGPGTFYGLRISTTSTVERKLYSFDAADNRPFVRVEWSDAPDAPINLAPSGGAAVSIAKPVLSYDYYDANGSDIDQQQVQINGTNDFSAPAFDSGMVGTDDPEYDTSTGLYAGIANGGSAWWRVKVTNQAGKDSDWSDPAQFTRVDRITATLDNPAAVDPVVEDATPEFSWTVTGTQVARRLILRDLADPSTTLEDKGRVHTSATTYTPDTGVITDESATYEVELRLHDLDTRAGTPGDPVYLQIVRQFTFREDATIDPVTSLAAVQDPTGLPAADLTWNDASFPDGYTIVRRANGGSWKFLEHDIDPADTFVSGTSHAWTDWTAVPNVAYDYKVRRRVNKKLGPGSTVAFTYLADEIWLTDVDTSRNVPLIVHDQVGGLTQLLKADVVGTYTTISGHVVQIWHTQTGLAGTVEADLVDYAGHTAGHWLDNLMWMKVRPDNKLRMVLGGRNLHVTLTNLTDGPIPRGKADWRRVTFQFKSHDGPTG
jgi:hypothetical protein